MNFLEQNCTLTFLNKEITSNSNPFSCNHNDLDDFFLNDCENYTKQLLGKSYCFYLNQNPKEIIAAFTLSNDSIKTTFIPKKTKNKINRKIPNVKRMVNYPAVLIGRLGVNKDYSSRGIGKEIMNFIKAWFIDQGNKTGCRYIVVDAYNNERTLKFYQDNNFVFIFSSEEEEKNHNFIASELNTRLMYFDLINLKSTPS